VHISFSPEFNIRLYDKNSESDFFFLHQNQNIFFSNIGNQNIFLEKNHTPSSVKWSFPNKKIFQALVYVLKLFISYDLRASFVCRSIILVYNLWVHQWKYNNYDMSLQGIRSPIINISQSVDL
jgi:hypothetical protein